MKTAVLYAFLIITCQSVKKHTTSKMTQQEARTIALEYMKTLDLDKPGEHFVIIDSKIIEKSYAWVFPITTEMHNKTGDIKYAVPGVGPIIVDRQHRTAHIAPTSVPIETYLKYYEDQLKKP